MKNDKEFLEQMSEMDSLVDHHDNCGECFMQICMAEAARQLLENNDTENGIKKWAELSDKLWKDGKYFKLYQQEITKGNNPKKAFDERNWQM